MDGGIRLRGVERRQLLRLYRQHADAEVRRRAQIVLLLADGRTWALIAAVMYCSSRTIGKWKHRFEDGGVGALTEERRGRRPVFGLFWIAHVRQWVRRWTPGDFGFVRSRWSCRLVVILMLEVHGMSVSEETVRRWMHRGGLVWRRPRPVLRPRDPQREAKLRRIRRLLATLPADEVAVFEDEVDIDLNPKIGSMWMLRGHQATVPTPGTNQKRYLAGSQNWRTGMLIVTEGTRRNSELFIHHLDDLRYHLRRYRKIHVICDNARFHDSRLVQAYRARHGDRIELHFLPKYSPQANPIERIWWKLHEQITRNHRCLTLDELLDLIFTWLADRRVMEVEDEIYFPKRAA